MSSQAICSIVILSDIESVWTSLTNERQLSEWYAPGSPWKIPELKAGSQISFTLMPSKYNNLAEPLPMTLTIHNIVPHREFAFYADDGQTLISFVIEQEEEGVRVAVNMDGYDPSLANLKALVEGRPLPYV